MTSIRCIENILLPHFLLFQGAVGGNFRFMTFMYFLIAHSLYKIVLKPDKPPAWSSLKFSSLKHGNPHPFSEEEMATSFKSYSVMLFWVCYAVLKAASQYRLAISINDVALTNVINILVLFTAMFLDNIHVSEKEPFVIHCTHPFNKYFILNYV